MSIVEREFLTEDLHPIDIVETLAEYHDWDFDRVTDDQIAMAVRDNNNPGNDAACAGGVSATAEQIVAMVETAVATSERFFPAFQLVCWADRSPEEALHIAIAEAYGRA